MNNRRINRREFLERAGWVSLACLNPLRLPAIAPTALPNPVGYATIPWPRKDFPEALETISKLGFKGVQVLGWVNDRQFFRNLE